MQSCHSYYYNIIRFLFVKISLVDETGCYTPEAGSDFAGLDVLERGTKTVLQYCEHNVMHRETIVHSYPYDWRTKKPIIVRASHQWFINTGAIKDRAIVRS